MESVRPIVAALHAEIGAAPLERAEASLRADTLSGSVLTTPNTGSGMGGAGGSTIYDYGFLGEASQIPEFRDGTDGFQYFGNGKLAMLHGWEAVIRPGDAAPSTRGAVSRNASRGGDLLPVTINVDGDALIRAFVRVGKRQGWAN